MKLLKDIRDIENVGEILVQSFVDEKQITESAVKLLMAKSSLITEGLDEIDNYLMESYGIGGSHVKLDYTHTASGQVANFTLEQFIVAYINYDQWPNAIDLMNGIGIPSWVWDGVDNPELSARNVIMRNIIPKVRAYEEGKKWVSKSWVERKRYGEGLTNSIHPNKIGYEYGLSALSMNFDEGQPEPEWNQEEMVDGGKKGKRNRSTTIIDQFNKTDVTNGVFYSDVTKIKPTVWGAIWRREKSSVRSERTTFGRSWKKIFVLGYQIERNVFYEVWYGTYDGTFTLHDQRGNQISRKFSTMSEVTRALTNAVVQAGSQDAEVFSAGGVQGNKIVASLIKTLNATSDTMIDDLMQIEDRDSRARTELEARRENKEREKARREMEGTWKVVRRRAQAAASAVGDASVAVGAAIQVYGVPFITSETERALKNFVKAGKVSKETADFLMSKAKQHKGVVAAYIREVAKWSDIKESDVERWAKDVESGKMTFEQFAAKVEIAKDAAERNRSTVDQMNARNATKVNPFSNIPPRSKNAVDNDKPEEVLGKVIDKSKGYRGMSTEAALADMANQLTPFVDEVGNNNIEKIRQYIATLVNTKVYSDGRSYRDEVRLITMDVYGTTAREGTVNSMIKAMKNPNRSKNLPEIIREGFGDHLDESVDLEQDEFDISDAFDSRRDAEVRKLRRGSEREAMTVAEFKNAINAGMVTSYDKTRIDESMWKSWVTRALNRGRKESIAFPNNQSLVNRVKMFFQGYRYRADFITGITLGERVNVEIWYVTELNPNISLFGGAGSREARAQGRETISTFYVFDVTSGSLIRKFLPYHKNAIQVAIGKLGVV